MKKCTPPKSLSGYFTVGASSALLLILSACGAPTPAPPTATNTPSGPSTAIIVTLPPRTLDRPSTTTPAPIIDQPVQTVENAPTLPPPTALSTAKPTITPSGPTVEPYIDVAQTIVAKVPRQFGNFTLQEGPSGLRFDGGPRTEPYRTTYLFLPYRTADGAEYNIFVTFYAGMGTMTGDFVTIANLIKSGQALTGLGDEAIISSVSNNIFILLRWRNVIIRVARPDKAGTLPRPITDDDIIALTKAIYNTIPGVTPAK